MHQLVPLYSDNQNIMVEELFKHSYLQNVEHKKKMKWHFQEVFLYIYEMYF